MSLVVSAQEITAREMWLRRQAWERRRILTPVERGDERLAAALALIAALDVQRVLDRCRLATGGIAGWVAECTAAFDAATKRAESRTGTALSRPGSGEDGGPAPLVAGPGRQH